MASSSPKLSAGIAAGSSVLVLQCLTAPLVLAGLTQDHTTPRWLVAIYAAVEAGGLAAGVLLVWGMRTKRRHVRWAPTVLLLPFWAAVAAAGPVVDHHATALLFSGFAVSMAAITSLPWLSRGGRALFERDRTRAAPLTLTTAGR